MIEEAYVSFEIAKLLKEKGFPQDPYICNTAYTTRGKLSNNAKSFAHNIALFNELGITSRTYSIAPTQQMAMRWLREKYKIGVFPSTYCIKVGDKVTHPYGTCIINLVTHEIMENDCMPRDTYEQACEAAIKYCLENLISK